MPSPETIREVATEIAEREHRAQEASLENAIGSFFKRHGVSSIVMSDEHGNVSRRIDL